jgi:hypothetical protein
VVGQEQVLRHLRVVQPLDVVLEAALVQWHEAHEAARPTLPAQPTWASSAFSTLIESMFSGSTPLSAAK